MACKSKIDTTGWVSELNILVSELVLENERLEIENKLLRQNSKEHQKLNGELREELKQYQNLITSKFEGVGC